MVNKSLFKISELPDSFGAVLLIFSFILLLSPYLSGADFGVFKIPVFNASANRWLKVVGPVVFCLCVLSFLPIIPTTNPASMNSNNGAENTPTSALTPTVTPRPALTPTPNPANARQAAEKLGADWFAAFKAGDVTNLTRMSDTPFCFGNELVLGPEDIPPHYEKFLSLDKPGRELAQFRNVEVRTVAELKKEGLYRDGNKFVAALNLSVDDFVVTIHASNFPTLSLYTRKVGSEIKVAGVFG